jgi:hypothetical protein
MSPGAILELTPGHRFFSNALRTQPIGCGDHASGGEVDPDGVGTGRVAEPRICPVTAVRPGLQSSRYFSEKMLDYLLRLHEFLADQVHGCQVGRHDVEVHVKDVGIWPVMEGSMAATAREDQNGSCGRVG